LFDIEVKYLLLIYIIYFRVEKLNKNNENYTISITTKDNRELKFTVLNREVKLFLSLYKLVKPISVDLYWAYSLKYHKYQSCKKNKNGWEIFDIKKEFERQNVKFKENVKK
jgi:hypothetical protein